MTITIIAITKASQLLLNVAKRSNFEPELSDVSDKRV